jgi:hypothetical protein
MFGFPSVSSAGAVFQAFAGGVKAPGAIKSHPGMAESAGELLRVCEQAIGDGAIRLGESAAER